MKNRKFVIAWIVLYVACVALSAFGTAGVFSGFVGVAFFVPPAVLLVRGIQDGNKKLVRTVRYLAIASLVLTTLALGGVILTTKSSELLQKLAEVALMLLGAPLLCFRAMVVSIFLWATLLFSSFIRKKQ